ncbi:MAG: allantoate amidohydrolase [Thermoleophilia bacterium]
MIAPRADAVRARAHELDACTETPGEITRSYGSDALVEARERVRGWLEQAGLEVRQDAVGNLVGRREADAPGSPTLVLASHVDSVRNAGRWDGPLGVLVAIAAAQRLEDEGIALPYALEVVAFVDEEGLAYAASYLGSRVWAGIWDGAERGTHDRAGTPFEAAVRRMGGDVDGFAEARRDPADLLGYLELHIEQGPVLEDEGLPVGVVTAIAGQSRGFVDVLGVAGHAGNTPMRLRRDALAAAAELVLAVEQLALEPDGPTATVGKLEVSPNVGNVIPGVVTLSYDVRHQDDAAKDAAVERLRVIAEEVCARRGLTHVWRHLQDHPATPMAPRLRALLVAAVEQAGIRPVELPSGAGHDAVSAAHLTDVSMLFVRCRGGVSHHPDEHVDEADVDAAVRVVDAFLDLLADDVRARGEA